MKPGILYGFQILLSDYCFNNLQEERKFRLSKIKNN